MDLNQLNGGNGRRPLPLEWRRHSFVRVRQPAAAERAAQARSRRPAPQLTERAAARTTQDDIAW